MTTSPRLMLDTNILSDMMRNPRGPANLALQQRLAQQPDLQVTTSVVVDCEIGFGLQRKGSAKLDQAYADLLQVVEIVPLESSVTTHYTRIRIHLEQLGQPIGPNDTLIAAHALALDATLVSADAEFMRVPGLKVENWLRPSPTVSLQLSTR
jgi:tRNA(fMet)-specific endonuclease VapC